MELHIVRSGSRTGWIFYGVSVNGRGRKLTQGGIHKEMEEAWPVGQNESREGCVQEVELLNGQRYDS